MPPTRREVLQLLGAGTLALAAGCGDNLAAVAATAVLDPDEHSVVVTVWTPFSVSGASIAVRTGGVLVREVLLALDGGRGALEVAGLVADTAHEITIAVAGSPAVTHTVRTAPGADDPRPVRLAISADYDPNPAFATGILEAVIAAAPELVISIGDFPYTDNGPPAVTVAAYRERHAELRTHPPVRALLSACGLAAIYDDHEFRNDWNAASAAAEPERYTAALQVWDEFFPRRPRQQPRRPLAQLGAPNDEIRYRSWRWGAHLECFLLDCRRFRSANDAPDDGAKTMLGAAQRRWLIDGLTASTATFKLVLTSVPLDFGRGDDHWASFTTERDAIFGAIVGIPGVLFMTADQHWFASHRHAFGIREIQIGPVARGFGEPLGAPPGVLFRAVRYNAGLIDVDGVHLTVTGIGEDGEPFYREVLTAADLTPRST
jgi:hypothetical protein